MFCDIKCLLCHEDGAVYVNFSEFHMMCLDHSHGILNEINIPCIHCECKVIVIADLIARSLPNFKAMGKPSSPPKNEPSFSKKCTICLNESPQVNDEICGNCFEQHGAFVYCECQNKKQRCARCYDYFCENCEANKIFCIKCRLKNTKCKSCGNSNASKALCCGHYVCSQCFNRNCPVCTSKCKNCKKFCDKLWAFPCGFNGCELCISSGCVTCLEYKDVACHDCGTSDGLIILECGHHVCANCRTCYHCLKNSKELEKCVICNEAYENLMRKNCDHKRCKNCISNPCKLCCNLDSTTHCQYCNKKTPRFKKLDCLHLVCDESYNDSHLKFVCNHEVCIKCATLYNNCHICYSKCESCKTDVHFSQQSNLQGKVLCSACRSKAVSKISSSLKHNPNSCYYCINTFSESVNEQNRKNYSSNYSNSQDKITSKCESCGKVSEINPAICKHFVCKKCFNKRKVCKACENHSCSNCFQPSIYLEKFMCKHDGCFRCNSNKICFKCILKNRRESSLLLNNGNCIGCFSHSSLIKLICGHLICSKCFNSELENTEYLCPLCTDKTNTNSIVCRNCKQYSKWSPDTDKRFQSKICCNKKYCMICFSTVNIKKIHKCECVII